MPWIVLCLHSLGRISLTADLFFLTLLRGVEGLLHIQLLLTEWVDYLGLHDNVVRLDTLVRNHMIGKITLQGFARLARYPLWIFHRETYCCSIVLVDCDWVKVLILKSKSMLIPGYLKGISSC